MEFSTREFEFEGLRISSRVVRCENNPNGGVSYLIESRLGGRSVQNYHTTSEWCTVPPAQQRFAKLFALRLRGIATSSGVAAPLIQIKKADGDWSAHLPCALDFDRPNTSIDRSVMLACGLMPQNQVEPGTDAELPASIPLRAKCGEAEFSCEAAVSGNQRAPCIVGQDIISLFRAMGPRKYYQFVGHEISWAYRKASEARESCVLLIGSFSTQGKAELERVQEHLFSRGYRGLLLDEFNDVADQSLDQKMMFLASLCRFVICLDAGPAGHYVELEHCARFGLVAALMVGSGGKPSSAMLLNLESQNRYLKIFPGDTPFDPVLTWAEKRAIEKASDFNKLYHWREGSAPLN